MTNREGHEGIDQSTAFIDSEAPQKTQKSSQRIIDERNQRQLARKQSIRAYSRSTHEGRTARSETARKILEKRQIGEQAAKQAELIAAQIQELKTVSIQAESDRQAMRDMISDLNRRLQEREISLVSQVMDYFDPQKRAVIQSDIEHAQTQLEDSLAKSYAEMPDSNARNLALNGQYAELSAQKNQVRNTEVMLDEFYDTQEKGLNAHRKLEQLAAVEARVIKEQSEGRGSISEVIREHEVIVIHSIRPDLKGARGMTDWRQKLAYVLEAKPMLAGSTIKSGDWRVHMWGLMGVILNGGRVRAAQPLDSKTTVDSSEKRHIDLGSPDETVEDQIKNAIQRRTPNRNNEFVIEKPQVSGFYIERDVMHLEDQLNCPEEEIHAFLSQIGMEVYLLSKGVATKARFDESSKKYVPLEDQAVTPREFIERTYSPSPEALSVIHALAPKKPEVAVLV